MILRSRMLTDRPSRLYRLSEASWSSTATMVASRNNANTWRDHFHTSDNFASKKLYCTLCISWNHTAFIFLISRTIFSVDSCAEMHNVSLSILKSFHINTLNVTKTFSSTMINTHNELSFNLLVHTINK